MFFNKKKNDVDYKARLEHKLYLARENPELIFDLADCGLKTVPPGIYSLCKVFRKTSLYLQDNHLTSLNGGGSLKDLSLIQILNIDSNEFKNLPPDIKYLNNLKILNLHRNKLKELPSEIGELTQLEILNVSNNNLTCLPKELGYLKHLHNLDVRDNLKLTKLPTTLSQIMTLKEIFLNPEKFQYPPGELCEEGTESILNFLARDLGIDRENFPVEEKKSSIDLNSSLTKDNSNTFEEQIMHLEKQKAEKNAERLALEKEFEEHNKREFEFQNSKKAEKDKLVEDLLQQENRLQEDLNRIQHDRDLDRQSLIYQLQEAEGNAGKMIEKLLEAGKIDPNKLFHLIEQERLQEEQLLQIRYEEYQTIQKKEILDAMNAILEQEYKRDEHLRQYEKDRIDYGHTLLGEEMKTNDQLYAIFINQEEEHIQLLTELHRDQELQRVAVGALLERSDARSWGIIQQVALVEQQLAGLTAIELERKRLQASEQMNDLSDQRIALSNLLLDLLQQKSSRQKQLMDTLNKMAQQNETAQSDFWLIQYQKLLDSRPSLLIEMNRSLDSKLALLLLQNEVIHCLPFLAKYMDKLHNLNEDDLIEAGIKSSDDRQNILEALNIYSEKSQLDKEESEKYQPSAPSFKETISSSPLDKYECVICMEEECSIIFLPCGHLCTCIQCSKHLSDCPLCRANINTKIRAILP